MLAEEALDPRLRGLLTTCLKQGRFLRAWKRGRQGCSFCGRMSGNLDNNLQHRIAAAWLKWREVTGVTCDSRMPIKLKGLVYKSVIRPVLTYGSETWAVTKKHVQTIQIRNEYVRGSLGVRDVADKQQENRLRWFGHVKRRPPDYIGNVALNQNLPGQRRRGRPKLRWSSVIKKDLILYLELFTIS
ncbi:hypothetical protein ABMA27_010427 [Loxostege sticticalis]|uniref:Endonuclease-reverse transcriptase n=1 Tax=Loxostege sticticalis TaxID=481309 RepID=A0ABR3H5P0_LOXSC